MISFVQLLKRRRIFTDCNLRSKSVMLASEAKINFHKKTLISKLNTQAKILSLAHSFFSTKTLISKLSTQAKIFHWHIQLLQQKTLISKLNTQKLRHSQFLQLNPNIESTLEEKNTYRLPRARCRNRWARTPWR